MRCRIGRALPAVAQCENWAVSRMFYWPITTMSAMRILWRVFFAARAWLGGIDRAGEDGVAYRRGQRRPHSPQMRSAWNLETDDLEALPI